MSRRLSLNPQTWGITKFLKDINNTNNKNEDISLNDNKNSEQSQRFALIYGGSTCLGSKCIAELKMAAWWVGSIDYTANNHADVNILLLKQEPPEKQEDNIVSALKVIFTTRKLTLIFCCTDAPTDGVGDYPDNLISSSLKMWTTHVVPPMICVKIASEFLHTTGILIFTGNLLAMEANAGKIGFNLSKSSVVHLTKCLALNGSSLPGDSLVVCLLPRYVDTATDREMYPHVHAGSFTPLGFITDLILSWGNKKNLPGNGSLCELITNNYSTEVLFKY